MRIHAVALVCILFASRAFAENVPGTSVDIKPPSGFEKTERFPGFINKETGSSIMITEIPGPFGEITSGFSDAKKMQDKGMKLVRKSSVKVDGHDALLLQIQQSLNGVLFQKWMLAVDSSRSTTLIVACYPISEAEQDEQPLKTAILSASFGKQSNPMKALGFTAKPAVPFKVATVIGQNLLLTPNGVFPIKDENVPLMVLGLSASKKMDIPDKKVFAQRHITQTSSVKEIEVKKSEPVKIGTLAGFTTLAEGVGDRDETPMIIYQVILFDSDGYCIIKGITPTAKKEKYLPIFEEIAKSFAKKQPSDKASDGDKR